MPTDEISLAYENTMNHSATPSDHDSPTQIIHRVMVSLTVYKMITV